MIYKYTLFINESGILVGVESLPTLSTESIIYDMQPSEQLVLLVA
jgi:hypothetical protein